MNAGLSWWAERSARERTMLRALGAVALVLALWWLVVRPLLDWRESAFAAHQLALDRRAEAAQLAARLASVQPNVVPAAVERLVNAAGLEAQIEAEAGAVRVRVEAARPDVLAALIERIETETGLSVRSASIERNADRTLGAELLFGGGQ